MSIPLSLAASSHANLNTVAANDSAQLHFCKATPDIESASKAEGRSKSVKFCESRSSLDNPLCPVASAFRGLEPGLALSVCAMKVSSFEPVRHSYSASASSGDQDELFLRLHPKVRSGKNPGHRLGSL